jgi:WD40 repeat protein
VGTGSATVQLSLDWKGVAVASTTHTLPVLDTVSRELPVSTRFLRSLPHPDRSATIWRIAFTPRGHLFTAGYPSGVVQLWDLNSGKELRRIESPRGYRGSADYALTPADFSTLCVPVEGRRVHRDARNIKVPFRVEYAGKVLVWDLATGKQRPDVAALPGHGVVQAYLSPDGTRLLTLERGGFTAGSPDPPFKIRLHDRRSGRAWDLGEGYVQATFSADSRRIYLARSPSDEVAGHLQVVDREGKELATLAQVKKANYSRPILSPDGKLLAVTEGKGLINEPAKLKLFDLGTGREIASFPSGGDYPFLMPAFSPDGRLLAAGDYDGQVTIIDVAKRVVARKHRFAGKALGGTVAFSPDCKRLAVPARINTDQDRARDPDPLELPQPRVFLFDLTQEAPPEEIVCPHGFVIDVTFSPDGKTLAVGGSGAVHLFDTAK